MDNILIFGKSVKHLAKMVNVWRFKLIVYLEEK